MDRLPPDPVAQEVARRQQACLARLSLRVPGKRGSSICQGGLHASNFWLTIARLATPTARCAARRSIVGQG
jgi:hypothetical protein